MAAGVFALLFALLEAAPQAIGGVAAPFNRSDCAVQIVAAYVANDAEMTRVGDLAVYFESIGHGKVEADRMARQELVDDAFAWCDFVAAD